MSEEVEIGGFRRVAVIQSGQNSDVWEVVDVATGKQKLAMKILISPRQQDKLQRASLRREAQIGAKLDHPNIIRFHKYVAHRRHPYILMELFPSSNLKLLQMRQAESLRSRLPRILGQACQSLEYLHKKGYVHRDVKPDNFLVGRGGDTRLIDFALTIRATGTLARLFHRPKSAAGTRSYISPEQIQGSPIDARADIYSFGVMMFELLAGRLPFMAPSGAELLRKHLKMEPPALPAEAGIQPAISELVRSMLAKKPTDRPASMADIAGEIGRHGLFRDADAKKA